MPESLPQIIEALSADWIASGEADSLSGINEGLCADFAHAVYSSIPDAEIYGVYDLEDLQTLPSGASSKFHELVTDDLIGHTAIFFGGRFYDAEAPHGVSSFEDLPICRRASVN